MTLTDPITMAEEDFNMEQELKSMDEWIGKMLKDSQRRLQDLLDQDEDEHEPMATDNGPTNGEVARDNHKRLMNEKEKV